MPWAPLRLILQSCPESPGGRGGGASERGVIPRATSASAASWSVGPGKSAGHCCGINSRGRIIDDTERARERAIAAVAAASASRTPVRTPDEGDVRLAAVAELTDEPLRHHGGEHVRQNAGAALHVAQERGIAWAALRPCTPAIDQAPLEHGPGGRSRRPRSSKAHRRRGRRNPGRAQSRICSTPSSLERLTVTWVTPWSGRSRISSTSATTRPAWATSSAMA